jgi:ATP-dependent protease HslVU (ClpYQ) peptidase subunit
MTICIAATAAEKYVVIAADRTLTLNLEPKEFAHKASSKLYEITPGFIVGTAGSPVHVPDLLRMLKAKAKGDAHLLDRVAECLKDLRKTRIEQEILRKFGWDFATYEKYYAEGRLLEAHARRILEEMDEFHVCIHLVTGCVLENGDATIHTIEDPGVVDCFDATGFAAVGSGDGYALQSMMRANYTAATPLMEAIYRVFEAKKSAEQAVGVGRRTDLRVILSNKKNVRLSDGELASLGKLYEAQRQKEDGAEKKTLERVVGLMPTALRRIGA